MNVIFLFFSVFLAACEPSHSPFFSSFMEKRPDGITAFTGQAMTMQYKVLVGQPISDMESQKIAKLIETTFYETDTIFNKWNPQSELSKLNRQKAGIATPISPYLIRLFKEANRIVILSDGYFDPTIEPLQSLWKKKLQQKKIPNEVEIKEIAPAIGWNKISFEEGLFKKLDDRTQLDFGGIAKGLCIDMMVERLNAINITNVFVEWGGEIHATGQHPEGRPWMIYISRLGDSNPEHAIATLALKNQAIATSGDYLQNWTLEQKEKEEQRTTYFHIFNPKTLKPLQITSISLASVSVITSSCVLADGLATVPFIFPSIEESKEWTQSIKEQLPETSFWMVFRNNPFP